MSQCTTLKDPDDKPWCSTKVDGIGNHVTSGGFWGHCGQDCNDTQSVGLNENAEFSFGGGKQKQFVRGAPNLKTKINSLRIETLDSSSITMQTI